MHKALLLGRSEYVFHSEATEIKLKPDLSGKLRHYATGCFVAIVGIFLSKLGRYMKKSNSPDLIRNCGDKF